MWFRLAFALAGDPGPKALRHSTGRALSVFETSIGAGPSSHVLTREDNASRFWMASYPSTAETDSCHPDCHSSRSRAYTRSSVHSPLAQVLSRR